MWYAYSMEPIDFGWEHLITVEDYLKTLAVDEAFAKLQKYPSESDSVDDFLVAYSDAQSAAAEQGWDGDIRGKAYVFFLPLPGLGSFRYGFAWKQDNNGVTFITSPVALSWLEGR